MRRGIVVIAPAWHSCGSYEVFKGQVETFKALGCATYFLAVSRKTRVWKHPAGYWDDYLGMTGDIGADFRGETHQEGSLLKNSAWRKIIAPALSKSVVTWRALPATLAPIPPSLREFIAGCERIDIVCNHYFNMPLAERIKAIAPGSRIILETHDIQSRQFLDQKLKHPVTGRAQEYDKMLAEEIAYCRRADILVHLNEDEAAEFERLLPDRRHELIFPMVRREDDNGEVPAEAVEPFDFLIVMSGNHSNYASLVWFLKEVWSPEFDQKFSLKIVGVIDQAVKTRNHLLYERYRHRFTGRVPSLAAYYHAAGTVLLPMIQGHGISVKTIEAMAYGKPIIGTRGAFRGFERSMKQHGSVQAVDTSGQLKDKLLAYSRQTSSTDSQDHHKLFDSQAYCENYRKVFSLQLDY